MRLFVIGATGGTGQEVVRQALEAGHDVTAFVRTPSKLREQHARLRTVAGSLPDDAAALAEATRGCDAVVSALGRGLTFTPDALIERSVPVLISAMQASGVRRLIFTSAFGVGESIRAAPFFGKLFMRTLLRNIYADKAIGEDLIRRSDLDWTIVHPVQLTDGPLSRVYRASEDLELRGMPKISRADTAHCIIGLLSDPQSVGKTIRVSY